MKVVIGLKHGQWSDTSACWQSFMLVVVNLHMLIN